MNQKINCLIIDDEPLAIQVLKTYMEELDFLEIVASFRSARKALSFLAENSVDLIFLDIQMPLLNGLDFVKSLEKPPAIIFTTAYRDFAVESYELDAQDYLVKPISFDRFYRSVDKYRKTIQDESPPLSKIDFLQVKADKKYYRIPFDEIHYIENIKDYVLIHGPKSSITVYERIRSLEESLPSEQFIRIHRSFIIALSKIRAFDATYVYLGEAELPIGRTYKNKVLQILNQSQ